VRRSGFDDCCRSTSRPIGAVYPSAQRALQPSVASVRVGISCRAASAQSSVVARSREIPVSGNRHSGERSRLWRQRQYLTGIGLASQNSSDTSASTRDQRRRAARWSLPAMSRWMPTKAQAKHARNLIDGGENPRTVALHLIQVCLGQ